MSLHRGILFLLLPFRAAIATRPVEKQSCESQSKDGNSGGNVNFLQSAQRKGFFFLFQRLKIKLMSNLRSNELKNVLEKTWQWLRWEWRSETCWIHCQTVFFLIFFNSTYFNSPYNPTMGIHLSVAAATEISLRIKSADKSEDAKSVHQNPLVVCY